MHTKQRPSIHQQSFVLQTKKLENDVLNFAKCCFICFGFQSLLQSHTGAIFRDVEKNIHLFIHPVHHTYVYNRMHATKTVTQPNVSIKIMKLDSQAHYFSKWVNFRAIYLYIFTVIPIRVSLCVQNKKNKKSFSSPHVYNDKTFMFSFSFLFFSFFVLFQRK